MGRLGRMGIEIVDSPRPEDDKMVLPDYHEILELLCKEFEIPGSPDLWSAIEHIKKKMEPPEQSNLKRKCKGCRTSIAHKHSNARFCNSNCKDNFWNRANPRGYAAPYDEENNPQGYDDDDDPSWDAHKH